MAPPAQIEIRVKAPGLNRLVAFFRKIARRGATSLSRRSVRNIAQVVADRNKVGFDRVGRESLEISMLTSVFSRKKNWIQGRNATVGIIIAQTNKLRRLFDTGLLMRSFTKVNHPKFKIEVGKRGIRIKSLVDYGSKHIKGTVQTFNFGSTERRRLNTRVPKPREKKGGKRNRTTVAREKGRAFYKLRGLAEEIYPATVDIPKRNYIEKMTRPDTAKINRIISLDLKAALARRRR